MRRALSTALIALLAWSGAEALPAQEILVIRTVKGGRTDRVIADTMGTPYTVPYSAGEVFTAIERVLQDLKIPVEVRDSLALQIGIDQFFQRGSLGGRSMSFAFDCGSGMSGPYADNYRMDLSLVTFVTPTGTGESSIRTVLLGNATNVNEGGFPTRPCHSKGNLERRIHELVLKKLRSR